MHEEVKGPTCFWKAQTLSADYDPDLRPSDMVLAQDT